MDTPMYEWTGVWEHGEFGRTEETRITVIAATPREAKAKGNAIIERFFRSVMVLSRWEAVREVYTIQEPDKEVRQAAEGFPWETTEEVQ